MVGNSRRPRGAIPSPQHVLAKATPHRVTVGVPAQFGVIPSKISYWGNDQYGNCTVAEEAYAKACYFPEIFVPDQTVIDWGEANEFNHGSSLTDVMDAMAKAGFPMPPQVWGDGAYTLVDYTNPDNLQSAICQGPVKIGLAADALEDCVGTANGWLLVNAPKDSNEDHCTSISGYGPMSWLASQLGGALPPSVDGSQVGYLMFTWSTIGIVDWASVQNIVGEAWLRNPTTTGSRGVLLDP